jgi:tyrosyl-tRNA synthetase
VELLDDLRARGLVHDTTDADALARRLQEGPIGVYCGFDPTADSLHVGHLMGQLTLRRFQLAGHRPFPLAGGATGMIGDPSGRSEERNLLDADALAHNVARISAQLERLVDFAPGLTNRATLVNNADWTASLSALEFLRDVGKHVTVNQMVAKESVRLRMDGTDGISYTEFSYMLLQANDFAWLCQHHDVELQLGGSDQWGNITLGIDLTRRRLGRVVHGLTWPLLTRSDGTKFGKTAGGAVWLDPERTSPYRFHQFWVQSEDDRVERLLRQFTFLDLTEVDELVEAHRNAPERRLAQHRLAHELTSLVHGEAAAAVLFGGDPVAAPRSALDTLAGEIPTTEVGPGELGLVPLLVRTGLARSNGEARKLVAAGGVSVNGERTAVDIEVPPARLLHGRYLLLRKGKANYHLVVRHPG